jgi:hypothetical protein
MRKLQDTNIIEDKHGVQVKYKSFLNHEKITVDQIYILFPIQIRRTFVDPWRTTCPVIIKSGSCKKKEKKKKEKASSVQISVLSTCL